MCEIRLRDKTGDYNDWRFVPCSAETRLMVRYLLLLLLLLLLLPPSVTTTPIPSHCAGNGRLFFPIMVDERGRGNTVVQRPKRLTQENHKSQCRDSERRRIHCEVKFDDQLPVEQQKDARCDIQLPQNYIHSTFGD